MKKIALITGARGGIGSAITTALLAQGYRIIATHSSVNSAAAHDWYAEQGYLQDQVRLLALDVADTAMCRETLGRLLQEEGRVDVLVNNAGITRDGAFKRMAPDQWFEVIHTNLCSLYNVTQPLFDAMCEQRDARIINISSVNGQKGQFGQVNYSAAKAGMLGFTKALAAEGARFGVTVNAIAPGYTATPMVAAIRTDILESIKVDIPMRRLAKPEEIAAAVAFLASEAGAYITGETLAINGGLYMK